MLRCLEALDPLGGGGQGGTPPCRRAGGRSETGWAAVPLVLEYEEILFRESDKLTVDTQDIQDLIDYLCAVDQRQEVYFLWRPYLRDMEDDFVLELAVAAQCDYIVTFNKRDFVGTENFGIRALTPQEFLSIIGELS